MIPLVLNGWLRHRTEGIIPWTKCFLFCRMLKGGRRGSNKYNLLAAQENKIPQLHSLLWPMIKLSLFSWPIRTVQESVTPSCHVVWKLMSISINISNSQVEHQGIGISIWQLLLHRSVKHAIHVGWMIHLAEIVISNPVEKVTGSTIIAPLKSLTIVILRSTKSVWAN